MVLDTLPIIIDCVMADAPRIIDPVALEYPIAKFLIIDYHVLGMVEIKLFTKNNCEKCVFVKERIPEGLQVQIINVEESADNLAEGAFYEVLDKGFPVLVVDDERVAEGAGPSVKKLKELAGQ